MVEFQFIVFKQVNTIVGLMGLVVYIGLGARSEDA